MKKTKFYNHPVRRYFLIDARGKILGRLASQIARILQGKNKAGWSPNFLSGDYVVVINAKHLRVSGNKSREKIYDKYSGYPGGRKEISLGNLLKKNPARVLRDAVKGMLPKNTLAKKMLQNLKIYPGEEGLSREQRLVKLEV